MSETALILGAVVASAHFRVGGDSHGRWSSPTTLPKALLITSVCQLCLYYGDLYDDPQRRRHRPSCSSARCRRSAITLLILAALYYCVPGADRRPRRPRAGGDAGGDGADRLAARLRVADARRSARASGCCSSAPARRRSRWRASCTSAAGARRRDRRLRRSRSDRRVGSRCSTPASSARSKTSRRSSARARVDRVVVSLADARGKLPMDKLLEMKLDGVTLRSPGVGLRGIHRQDRGREPASELADFLGRLPQDARCCGAPSARSTSSAALVGLVAGAPLMLLVAAAIKLTSPGRCSTASSASASTAASSPSTSSARCAQDAEADTGAGLGRPRRRARHADRPLPAPDAARRAAAALERARRRHEPGRPAARAAGVRRSR